MVFKKLPKHITIRGQLYFISYHKKLIDHELGSVSGLCISDKKELKISLDEDNDAIQSTVIHEILHALSYEYDFYLSEKVVLKLEKSLYETFKTNKWHITHPNKQPSFLNRIKKILGILN